MHAVKRHLAAATALVFMLAALAGSALAAPPTAPPGQEQTPPGQEKKADPAAAPAAPAPAAVPAPSDKGSSAEAKASAPGQVKKSSATTSKPDKSSGINSTTSGVKPSSTTDKNTLTTAGHNPDQSKRYGHGGTAAQIATSRGAPGNEKIYGPGNSQPHKVCKKVGKNGKIHWVDVHAVKSYPAPGCATTTSTSLSAAAQQLPGPAAVSSAPAAVSVAGGVAGVVTTVPAAGQAEAGGVAGAFGVLGAVAGGSLPFTGLPLWAIVLIACTAIAFGLALWRGSAPATRDVV